MATQLKSEVVLFDKIALIFFESYLSFVGAHITFSGFTFTDTEPLEELTMRRNDRHRGRNITISTSYIFVEEFAKLSALKSHMCPKC